MKRFLLPVLVLLLALSTCGTTYVMVSGYSAGASQLSFTSATNSVNKGSTVTATVNLSPASAGTVTVQYDTADITAYSHTYGTGQNYTAKTAQTLTFNPGDTTKDITVSTSSNPIPLPDLTFSITLSNPINAALGSTPVQTVTIVDTAKYFYNATLTYGGKGGLVGDGVTDNHTQLIELIEYIYGLHTSGNVLYFPDGDYLFTAYMGRLLPGITYVGESRANTIIRRPHDPDQFRLWWTSTDYGLYDSNSDSPPMVFKNMTFEGGRVDENLDQNHNLAILCNTAKPGRIKLYIDNVTSQNSFGDAISIAANIDAILYDIETNTDGRHGIALIGGNTDASIRKYRGNDGLDLEQSGGPGYSAPENMACTYRLNLIARDWDVGFWNAPSYEDLSYAAYYVRANTCIVFWDYHLQYPVGKQLWFECVQDGWKTSTINTSTYKAGIGTVTYSAANTCTAAGDYTATYPVGTPMIFSHGDPDYVYKTSKVQSINYSGGTTTIVIEDSILLSSLASVPPYTFIITTDSVLTSNLTCFTPRGSGGTGNPFVTTYDVDGLKTSSFYLTRFSAGTVTNTTGRNTLKTHGYGQEFYRGTGGVTTSKSDVTITRPTNSPATYTDASTCVVLSDQRWITGGRAYFYCGADGWKTSLVTSVEWLDAPTYTSILHLTSPVLTSNLTGWYTRQIIAGLVAYWTHDPQIVDLMNGTIDDCTITIDADSFEEVQGPGIDLEEVHGVFNGYGGELTLSNCTFIGTKFTDNVYTGGGIFNAIDNVYSVAGSSAYAFSLASGAGELNITGGDYTNVERFMWIHNYSGNMAITFSGVTLPQSANYLQIDTGGYTIAGGYRTINGTAGQDPSTIKAHGFDGDVFTNGTDTWDCTVTGGAPDGATWVKRE